MHPLFAIVALLAAGLSTAIAQPLVCPPVAAVAGKPCELFHYHVQMFRPDTRGFVEIDALNQFSSQSACDRARDAQFKRNAAVVELFHMQRHADWWLSDKFGPCHCDMTVEKASPNMLTEAARWSQVQLAEEIRQRVRERLLDAGVASDAELVRGLIPPSISAPLIGGPKLTIIAPASKEATPIAPESLRVTKAVDATNAAASSLDLPLADISLPGIGAPHDPAGIPAAPASLPAPEPLTPSPSSSKLVPGPVSEPQSPPAPAPVPAPASLPSPAPAPVNAPADTAAVLTEEADLPAPEDVADAFISYESQRIQNVLKVSGSIGDESVKAQVLEVCTQRIQLLSNLRSIIVGSGARSRLVTAANGAKKEGERLAVVARLFGNDIPPHWAPKDAEDVVFDLTIPDPEHVLREATTTEQEKRHALYLLLATSSPTEQQQLWLASVIEGLLR